MEINEVQDLLNIIAKELFPDLKLKFLANPQQIFVQTAFIMAESFVYIDVNEIVRNDVFNTAKAKTILKKRTHEALLQLRDHVQNSLDKLEGE